LSAPSLSQHVFGATLWNALLLAPRLLVGALASVVYYQYLSKEQVAVVFLLTSLATSIGLFADLGIERSLSRFLPEVEHHEGRAGVERFMRRVMGLKLIALLVPLVALFAFAGPLSRHLAEEERREAAQLEARARETSPARDDADVVSLERQAAADRGLAGELEERGASFLAAVAALLVLGALFDVYMQFLTAYFRQQAWNLITLATTLLQPLLVTLFIVLGWGIGGVLLGLVLTPLVSVLLARGRVRSVRKELPAEGAAGQPDPGLRRRFLRFAAVTYLMNVTTWLYDIQFVVFVSAATLSLREVALLGFAFKFAKDFLGYVWTPLNGVITPLLTRIKARASEAALADGHASLVRLVWLLLLPAGTGLALLAPGIIDALYPKYGAASGLAIAFIAFTFAESLLSVPQSVLMVYDRYPAVLTSRLLALLTVPLVLLLLPRYGLLGVAIAVGIVRVGARLVTVVAVRRIFGLGLPWAFGSRVLLSTALFSAALLGLMKAWPLEAAGVGTRERLFVLLPLGGYAVIGAALFLVALRLCGGLQEDERRRLLALPLPAKSLIARLI
jgi:O-antigen/teichoic acid export membrane protein